MIEQYEFEKRSVIENTDFKEADIFDISISPHVEELAKTFNFYRGELTVAKKYNVESSFIFFLNNTTVNAKAGINKGNGIICINSGLIIWLIQNLFEKPEIDTVLKERYKEISEFLDNPIHILIYQTAQHFTFYHELAHLIQKSENLNHYISERPQEIKNFDLINHKLEMDADSFCALSIAAHVHQYAFKIFGEDLTSSQIESVIEILCAGVLLYLLSFEANNENIYFEEQTHPHPVIRILNVILIITDYCKNSPKLKEKEITINHSKIFEQTIDVAMQVEDEVLKQEKAKNFTKIIGKEKKNILNYFTKIRESNPEDVVMAFDKWNETVPKNYGT